MDSLQVSVIWRGEAAGDIREAAELLREIADRIEAGIDSGARPPFRVISAAGGVAASARIVRDKR